MNESVVQYVSDLEKNFVRGTYNIIPTRPRGGKTFWAMNELANYTSDGDPSRVLFLTSSTQNVRSLTTQYPEQCVEASDMWRGHCSFNQDKRIGVMCYQGLGADIVKQEEEPLYLKHIEVICWDECDDVMNYAASEFKQVKKLVRPGITLYEALHLAENVLRPFTSLALLGWWEKEVQSGKRLLIGMSGTPQTAISFFSGIAQIATKGQIQMIKRLGADIYFREISALVKTLTPAPEVGYWTYSAFIEENKKIVELANSIGFRAIELHSLNNTDHPMNKEQKEVLSMIEEIGMVPKQYDFVVVNDALARGLNLIDKRFINLIVNSPYRVDKEQAGRATFPIQRYLLSYSSPVPSQYLDKWMTIDECRQMAETMNVFDPKKNQKRALKWRALKDYLPSLGYQVEEKRSRANGKDQKLIKIIGEWHDDEREKFAITQLNDTKNNT